MRTNYSAEDRRLRRLSRICPGLPVAERQDGDSHAAFLVRKRMFAYFLINHHGDGIVSICARTLQGDGPALIAADPARFYSPAYIGPRGWVGLRLDQGKIDWEEVRELIAGSYLMAAPKRLAAIVLSQFGEPAIGKQLRSDTERRVVRHKK